MLKTTPPSHGRKPLQQPEFIHYSTQEFFTKHPSILFDVTDGQPVEDEAEYTSRAQAELTTNCLAYFRSPFLTKGSCPVSGKECRRKFPFLEYASLNWGKHAHQSALTAILWKTVLDLFDKFCEVTTTPGDLDSRTTENPFKVSWVRESAWKRDRQVLKLAVEDLVVEAYQYGSALVVAASFGISKLLFAYFAERKNRCRSLSQRTRLLICTAAAWHGTTDLLCWMLETYPDENLNHHGLFDETPLWMACAAYNRQETSPGVQALVEKADLDLKSPMGDGRISLVIASRKGLEGVIKLLLERVDVDVNKPGKHGWTPLNTAVYNNNSDAVKMLLERADVDVNKRNMLNMTPLYTASCEGHTNIAKLLLARLDVDVNKPDNDGWTPLYIAASKGHTNSVKLLLERADVDTNRPADHERTPLYTASSTGRTDIVKLLLERVDVELNQPDIDGRTPLHGASSTGHTDIVKLLLARADVDVNKPDKWTMTPLLTALWGGHTNIVKLLLERVDVDVNRPKMLPNKLRLETPNVDVNNPDEYGSWAEEYTNRVKLLPERTDVGLQLRNGWTPLHVALITGHTDIVKLLLERTDVDVNQPDIDGRTPLHEASSTGYTNIAKLLLERADVGVNQPDNEGCTPLYTASSEGRTNIVKMLLERVDVDVTKADNFGRTPLDGVIEERRTLESYNLPGKRYEEIEELLRSRLGLPKAEAPGKVGGEALGSVTYS